VAAPHLAALGFERPWFALALLLPLVLLWLARRAARPEALHTSAFELWLRVRLARPAQAAHARRTLPLSWVLYALGLAALSVGLMQPRPARGDTARPLRVVVDRSPSMYLADGARTRWAAALAAFEAQADAWPALRGAADGVLWVDAGADPPELVLARWPPADWAAAPRAPRAALDWARHDAAGVVFLSDDAEALAAAATRSAGWVASGGAAVPGPVGRRGALRVDWDGGALVEREDAQGAARVSIDRALDAELARFARVWTAARGLLAVEDAPAPAACELALVVAPGAAGDELELGREGWSARARVLGSGCAAAAGCEPWLRASDGRVLVSRCPGRVEVALDGLRTPAEEAAAFAVSWGGLFDAALLPAPGVVTLDERRAARAGIREPLAPPTDPEIEQRAARWRAACFLAAAACVAAAFALVRLPARAARG